MNRYADLSGVITAWHGKGVERMNARFHTLSLIAFGVCLVGATFGGAQIRTQEQPPGPRVEASSFFGVLIAGKELGRGVNATGGHEQLIARLSHGGAVGLRIGLHRDLLGVEVSVLNASNTVQVNNEFGIKFPNHGNRPVILSGDGSIYPFRKAIREGKVTPYLTSGIGGILMTADLENIDDQERHYKPTWNAGGGVKVFAGESQNLYLDLRFTNHRVLSSNRVDLRSITVGVGYRF